MILLIAAILAIFLLSMTTYEHMTNKDVMSALKKYGTDDDKKKTSKPDQPVQAPIYGPKAPPVEHPTPTKPSSKGSSSDSSVYPDIYGPDVPMEPGKKCSTSGKHTSDDVEDCSYQFNQDLQKAFPTNGPPQPFLTDFSKFQG